MPLIVLDPSLDLTQNDAPIQQDQTSVTVKDILKNNVLRIKTPSALQRVNSNLMKSVSEVQVKHSTNTRLLIKIAVVLLLSGAAVAGAIIAAVVVTQRASKVSIVSRNTNALAQPTTTVLCGSGYVQTSSGTCVNTQIDFNNCGSVGYVCASHYTSCSAGTCDTSPAGTCDTSPAVQLVGAITVSGFNDTTNGTDDETTSFSVPVGLTLYNYTTNTVTVSSNGVLCLDTCSDAWANSYLPDPDFGGPTVFGFWDDLFIYSDTSQAIYYAVNGTAPNRITTFEFYESNYASSQEYYHFQIIFYENLPNIVKCLYFETYDDGISATIGVQGSSNGPAITYSVDQANIVAFSTSIVFDTNAGTFTRYEENTST